MSEGDVSLIHDEDVLRRMWQQTEDFSRKKEIRAHMYRLREERLRNLYSPEPTADGKGCEFTSPQGHVQSFADQSFQSMKSKEVRDAGSPPKEFTYRGQDLKELSNAGWNVESENRTSVGHTHVKSVHANIEGRYDVQGGVGQFVAVDHNKQARTEYRDGNSSLKRDETSCNTAAHEQVVRKTDDGTHFSSTTSSSATSKVQQVSTRHETVPLTDDYDHTYTTNRNEQLIRNKDYEHTLKKDDSGNGDLLSRKVEYPDENTRVIVETRCLPDGTRVTSTRREFRAPAQSTRSEQHSLTRTENKYSTQNRSDQTSTSKVTRHSEHVNDIVDSQRNVDDYDFKRQIANYTDNDDYSGTENVRRHETNKKVIDSKSNDNYSHTSRYETKVDRNFIDHMKIEDDMTNINLREKFDRKVVDRAQTDEVDNSAIRYETNRKVIDRSQTDDIDHRTTRYETIRKVIDRSQTNDDDHSTSKKETNRNVINRSHTDDVNNLSTRYESNRQVIDHSNIDDTCSQSTRHVTKIEKVTDHSITDNDVRRKQHYENVDDVDRREIIVTRDDRNSQKKDVRDTQHVKNSEERIHTITSDKKDEVIEKKTTSDQYQTTYQTDYPQKKISNDWSPSHQAWASTLRSDTPTTRPSTRASSPGSRTFKSSTSSLRSSVSPDKTSKKPLSRGSSPNKIDRFSPTRTVSNQYTSNTHSTHSVTETKTVQQADKRPPTGCSPPRPGYSPNRKTQDRPRPSASPEKRPQDLNQRPSASPERKPTYKSSDGHPSSPTRPAGIPSGSRQSPEKKPSYKPADGNTNDSSYPRATSPYRSSPERKPNDGHPKDSVHPNKIPDKKPGPQKSVHDHESPASNTPRTTSPSRPHKFDNNRKPTVSPDRKQGYQPTDQALKSPTGTSRQRFSESPDRKSEHMTPTAPSKSTPSSLKSPTEPSVTPDNKSHAKASTDDRNSKEPSRITSVKEDHYKFVDEETKMYTRTDKADTTDNLVVTYDQKDAEPRDKSPSVKKIPNKNNPASENSPRKHSTSPHKDHVSFTKEKIDKTKVVTSTTDVTSKYGITKNDTTKPRTPQDNNYPDSAIKRDPSPTKYSTYDKKQQPKDFNDRTPTDQDYSQRDPSPSKFTSDNNKIYNSQERDTFKPHFSPSRESSPTKYDTYNKKKLFDVNDEPTSKNKEFPNRAPSPIKNTGKLLVHDMKGSIKKTKDKDSPKPNSERETSPSMYSIYKKQPENEIQDITPSDISSSQQQCAETETTITTNDTKNTKYDSLTRDDLSTKKSLKSLSPTKKSPRDRISPTKSSTKDNNYKHTTDFLAAERTKEEINKRNTLRDRPRQLVTPSSSPTRQPKPETEPSTGQSSPTTSVSGFVYFGSPRPEEQPIITDLDDQEFSSETTNEKPTKTHKIIENLEEHSQVPSKIPCRSPSPEKSNFPAKDSLPRKSSLKKPNDLHQTSPTEKPPTSFRVSPSDEQGVPNHTIDKKDHPEVEGQSFDFSKPKPPLERRETYEDRCKKMLGMCNTATETIIKETKNIADSKHNIDSPSVSPSLNPSESSLFQDHHTKNNLQINVADFITREKNDIIPTTCLEPNLKSITSREISPTKLKDIVTTKSIQEKFVTNDNREDNIITKSKKFENSRKNSEKNSESQVDEGLKPDNDSANKSNKKTCNYELEHTLPDSAYHKTSPTSNISRDSLSPEKKPSHERDSANRASPEKSSKQHPKGTSPERKPGYVKSITTVTSKHDMISKEDVTSTTIKTKSSTFDSPTRDVPQQKDKKPRTTSSSKTKTSDVSPTRESKSPVRKTLSRSNDDTMEKPDDRIPKESSPTAHDKTTKYMKMSSAVTSKNDIVSTTDDIEESLSTIKKNYSKSPSRQIPTDFVPESSSDYRRNTSPSPKNRSPEKEPKCHEPSSPSKTTPGNKNRKYSSPEKSPEYVRTTTMATSKYDTTSNSQDIDNITICDNEHSKHIPKPLESSTQHISIGDKPTSSSRPRVPSDRSPERKLHRVSSPTKDTPMKNSADTLPDGKSPNRTDKNSRYKLTSNVTTEYDTASTIEDIESTTQTVKHTLSPTRSQYPKDYSPEKKSNDLQPSSPTKDSPMKILEDRYAKASSPTRSDKTPDYMKTTTAVKSKYENIEDIQETVTAVKDVSKHPESPFRQTPVYPKTEYPKSNSPTRDSHNSHIKPDSQQQYLTNKDSPKKMPGHRYPNKSPSPEPNKTPGYMKTTTAITSKLDTTSNTEDIEETFSSYTQKNIISRNPESPTRQIPPSYPRSDSPSQGKYSKHGVPTRDSPSPDRKLGLPYRHSPTVVQSSKTTEDKHQKDPSPTKPDITPSYMSTKTSITSKYDIIDTTDNREESDSSKILTKRLPSSRFIESPTSQIPDHAMDTLKHPGTTFSKSEYPKDISPKRVNQSPELKPGYQHLSPQTKDSPNRSGDRHPEDYSKTKPKETPGYMRTTTAVSTKHDTTSKIEDIQETITTKIVEKKQPSRPTEFSTHKISKDKHPEPGHDCLSKSEYQQPYAPIKNSSTKKPAEEYPEKSLSSKLGSRDSNPGYMKPTVAVTSKHESIFTKDIEEHITSEIKEKYLSLRSSVSPTRKTPPETTKPDHLKNPEEPRQLRTPSPIKKTMKATEVSTDFIMSEREQELLDKVQKSPRKLSPERKEMSPSREKSSANVTTRLRELNITETIRTNELSYDDINETSDKTTKYNVTCPESKEEKPREQNVPSKPSSRNVSPTKKARIPSPMKAERTPETSAKSRSISPKKPFERPHSPQVPKISGIKPKESTLSHLTRKPTPITITASRVEKSVTADVKKTIGITKQNSVARTTVKTTASKFIQSPTIKTESDPKQVPSPKGIRDTGTPKKNSDTKVTRTVSDITMKYNKTTSPQRMKSKPEIQVNDISTTRTTKMHKSIKEPQAKFPGKPKSATALNTSTDDDDDVIIDVQQSKSSRENSPDRICPTPINFSDDVGTPRFPDEVSEPDDEFRKRTHHTIHEAESIVDDIVEICEDDELFTKRTNVEDQTNYNESLLNVQDKVTKFKNKIENHLSKPKDTSTIFKDTEKRVHSDLINENLQTDECLLSVSEKVNKFAKGPKETRDGKSPSRNIMNEYDKDTIYQDDYTKLSVNDKAHLFVETAENIKAPKVKSTQKIERPDLTNVDDSLKTDDCLLSVSDKVNKFVKTAEQFLTETQEVDEKEQRIKEQHDKIMRQIVDDSEDETIEYTEQIVKKIVNRPDTKLSEADRASSFGKDTASSQAKVNQPIKPNPKLTDRSSTVKITTLRSSEAVRKAKALFENIASTTTNTKETTKITKLTDIGVSNKSPKSHNATDLRLSAEEESPKLANIDTKMDTKPHSLSSCASSGTATKSKDDNPRSSPSRLIPQPPEMPRSKSPLRHTVETTITTKMAMTKNSAAPRAESPRQRQETDKIDKVPGYLRPTKTSQNKEEKVVEDTEISSRRGSGKFGVELRRTSVERAMASTERRRSVEHPCIEDIFDLDLLEQMLEKVVGYEQRRRIRAQIRVAKKEYDTSTFTKTIKTTVSIPKSRSPEPHRSPDRTLQSTPHKTTSPDRKSTPQKTVPQPKDTTATNGHSMEKNEKLISTQRPHSPEKSTPKAARQPSPDKKTRPQSPTKAIPKSKGNRFNEYATAYMKKVGLNEATKAKVTATKKKAEVQHKPVKQVDAQQSIEHFSNTLSFTERTSSRDVIEIAQISGKRSPSPDKRQSAERQYRSDKKQSPERQERSPSPEINRHKPDTGKRETIIKTVYEIENKVQPKAVQEEKPSWVTNRNLKKITSETRTFSSKKLEPEKPKYRAPSPSKIISKPIDVITSSYGPGPLDQDGKPLFGIKALRNGGSNYQVKGTVVRSEYHSRNGGAPSGSVSVTAYSSQPEELEQLLQVQGAPPSRLHGLAAITTTRKFGGDTGTTIQEAHGKEERAAIEQFTHSDCRVTDTSIDTASDTYETLQEITGDIKHILGETTRIRDENDIRTVDSVQTEKTNKRKEGREREERRDRMELREDKKTLRQNSVKSLTEKYIKSASETAKSDRSAYPKAGLILRTATVRDSVSSDSSAHAGLARTDSEHSLGSVDDAVVTTTTETIGDGIRTVTTERVGDGVRTTTTTTSSGRHERSFLDSNTKVTGVQDILTRMKNADIVIQEGDTNEDAEARALLNKFLGATVLMAGMQGYVADRPDGKLIVQQETVRTGGGKVTSSHTVEELDLDQCWDERVLRKLLDECSDYEQRRRLRARIRTLMAEQEACTNAVTEALSAAGESTTTGIAADSGDTREEEEVTVTSSVRRDSSEKIVSSSSTTTKTSKVTESMTRPAPKPVSPFAKFRQLEKQNSTNSPNSPKTPQSPGSPSQPYFKFTDPALQASALTIKERLLQWCRDKTRDYENVKLENFSTSWADGLAFCALLHHFLPHAFDYSQLTPDKRRHNFTLAFRIADEKAGIYPLLDVDDMVTMRKPDWKCVFTYVQSIHRRFKDQD